MAERVFLHIGSPKTGTTFLQEVLFSNKRALREQGVLVPGKNRFFHGAAARAVREGPGSERWPSWERLVKRCADWPGTVIVRNEWFSMADEHRAKRAIEDLAPAEVHLVITTRDLVELVPAAWQEALTDGKTPPLEKFVKNLGVPEGRWQWGTLDPAVVLDRWRCDLPPERIHVVTVPPKGSGPSPLWSRFAGVTGIDPETCDTKVDFARQSLSVEGARLLQLMGPGIRANLDTAGPRGWESFKRWVEGYLAHEVIAPHGGHPIALRRSTAKAVRKRSRRSAHALKAAGYDVVGGLDELTAGRVPKDGIHPKKVPDAALMRLSVQVIPVLLARVQAEAARADALDEVG